MKERNPALRLGLGALVFAVLPAVFCVFQPLFTDTTDLGEHALSLVLTAAAYLGLGALLGYFWPPGSVRWGLLISVPALLLVAWYTLGEPDNLGLHLAYAVLTLVAACLGAYAGARVRGPLLTP